MEVPIVRAYRSLVAALALALTGCSALTGGYAAGEAAVITRKNPASLVDPTRMGYSHVVSVRNGTLVFIAGQGPTDAAGKAVGRGDLRAQARQAVDNILNALAALEAGPENILYLRINVVGYQPRMLMELAPELRRLQGDGDKPAASIFVGVESLIVPGTLIEIETVAAI
jgi:enamine deaminase RidA (YjgF/YER057c/UK114 family)